MDSELTAATTLEWLETDRLGGFASGTAAGIRTRRYHALLLAATTPPTSRMVLVNGFEAWVETASGRFAISSQMYAPEVIHPDGWRRIVSFEPFPNPRWVYALEDGTRIEHQFFVSRGSPRAVLSWRHLSPGRKALLAIRPFFSGRDYHSLHRENSLFRFDPESCGGALIWHPYPDVPAIVSWSNGEYDHRPDWYRNFLYLQERMRGLDCLEDLVSPGILRFDLSEREALWVIAAEQADRPSNASNRPLETFVTALRGSEIKSRAHSGSDLYRAADHYIVRRGAGKTIIAGYPWFTDWGRDTFVAIRGLCIAARRLDDAREILTEWAGAISEGMLPNRFPDRGEVPEFNSVDAGLWFVIAVSDFLDAARACGRDVSPLDRKQLEKACEEIISVYARGTRHGIRADHDGLLMAGEPGVQLTWMDAKVGDSVITPRVGKPVEVQALWLNALRIVGEKSRRWQELLRLGLSSFSEKFWCAADGYLYDVVDVNHAPGTADPTFRPNQIFAVGGLPMVLLDSERARMVVDAVEARLVTPLGLRTLARDEPGYAPRYEGDGSQRDAAYHQGPAWPWLLGPFVEAWVRVRGATMDAKAEARSRFLEPLIDQMGQAGLGHISELVDGEPPFAPRGCPFQAWSIGEALRLTAVVLAEPHE